MAAAAAGALLGRVQAHVANLAASTHNARYHVTVDDNAAAHAGTDGDHHHVLHAPGRTEPGLAHSGGVGIVLVLNDRVGTVLLNGDPQLGQVNGNVGLDLGIARRRNGARNGQANACHKGARNLRLGDHLSIASVTAAKPAASTIGGVGTLALASRFPSSSNRPSLTEVPPTSMPM